MGSNLDLSIILRDGDILGVLTAGEKQIKWIPAFAGMTEACWR